MPRTAGVTPQGARIVRVVCTVGATVILGLGLAGCAGTPAPPNATGAPSDEPSAAPASARPAAPDPTLVPELGAADNLDSFDFVAAGVLAADPAAGGRPFIDALVAGGFDKSQMELTPDRTVVDLAADSIQFSVRWGGECLIGQTGPATGGYHSIVAPVLATGTCLVGATRQIDW